MDGTKATSSVAITPSSSSSSAVVTPFMLMHNAYMDEWLTISFLPFIKSTFNTENHYYDISKLNLKKVNFHQLPINESMMAMDRQYQSVRQAFDRILHDTDQERSLQIETYVSSFATFIESEKMIIEQAITDIGGKPPSLGGLTSSNNNATAGNGLSSSPPPSSTSASIVTSTQQQQGAGTFMASARSRATGNMHYLNCSGPITLLWTEFMSLLSKLVDPSEREFYYESTITNIAPSIFEWRIMLFNSQKIINDEKQTKKNPFVNSTYYDHYSSSFITTNSNITTTNNNPSPRNSSSSLLVDVTDLTISEDYQSSSPQNNDDDQLITATATITPSITSSPVQSHSPPQPPKPLPIPPKQQQLTQNQPMNNSPSPQNHMPPPKPLPQTPNKEGGGGGWHKAVVSSKPTQTPLSLTPHTTAAVNNSTHNVNNQSIVSNSHHHSSINMDHDPSCSSTTGGLKGIPNGGIVKQGWMKKRGNKVKGWKKRYFILDVKRNLIYYQYKKDKETNSNVSGNQRDSKEIDELIISAPNTSTNNINLNNNNNNNSNNIEDDNNNTNNNNNSKIEDDFYNNNNIQLSLQNLKYKGSIELHTAIAVAIKPNSSNINVNLDDANLEKLAATSTKEDSHSYFGIDIITPKRTWHLCCQNSKVMDDWLLALKGFQK